MKILFVGGKLNMDLIRFAAQNDFHIQFHGFGQGRDVKQVEPQTLLFEIMPMSLKDTHHLMDMRHPSTTTAVFTPKRTKKKYWKKR